MTSLHEPYPRPWGYRRETGRTDRSGIVIPAARERIYAALRDPSALETWLPPANMRGRVLEFDARPGGVLRMELTYVDGSPGKSSEHSDVTEVTFGISPEDHASGLAASLDNLASYLATPQAGE